MLNLKTAPFGIDWRQLWLPQNINTTLLPSSSAAGRGRLVTLTGAAKRTTCDGVLFDGSATSNINSGAIRNNAAKSWLSFRFRPASTFATGAAADQFLWGKYIDADNYMYIWLENADGKLYFKLRTAATDRFTVSTVETSWAGGVWYHVLASISSANGVRLRINNGAAVTDADLNPTPNGGDFVIGDFDDPGAGTGFKGVITDFIDGTDDLSATEEGDLYSGVPPTDAGNLYTLDEGIGVIAYDRGSSAVNGTLDTSALWNFGTCKKPALSFDGINDVGISAAGIDISGSITCIWAGKIKSLYNGINRGDLHLYKYYIDANNFIECLYQSAANNLRCYSIGGGAGSTTTLTPLFPSYIDEYWIVAFTLDRKSSQQKAWVNGALIRTNDAGGNPLGAATAYIGRDNAVARWDVSRPLLIGIINGALDGLQVLQLSHWLNSQLSMGIKIAL